MSYRWTLALPDEKPTLGEGNSTLVEFWLTEQDGAILLRVVESGFVAITAAAGDKKPIFSFDDNSEGWTLEVAILKSRAEGASA